jgi:cytochrome c556
MLRVVLGLAALTVAATAVLAQGTGAISQRKDAMKAIAGATKEPTAMIKGEAKFDLAKVQAALQAIETNAAKAKGLFPDDSKDGDTAVLAVAFTNKSDFLAKFDALASAAKAARTAITDEATLKTEWAKVASNCGGCHKVYRAPPKK